MNAEATTTVRPDGGEWVFAVLNSGDHWPVGRIRRRWWGAIEATPWGRPLFGVFRCWRRPTAIRRLVREDAGPQVSDEPAAW